ncbi:MULTISPECIES: hypothetical protein [unclassified Bradyrhizobium]|uniref:hypothetical protein n=1 Tax=unclassified Bradyrhizobium TaxID=2631580 RepID=UPI002FF373DD
MPHHATGQGALMHWRITVDEGTGSIVSPRRDDFKRDLAAVRRDGLLNLEADAQSRASCRKDPPITVG